MFLAILVLSPNIIIAQSDQTFKNGDVTAAINFSGTGCNYNWINSNPSIGLSASGTGDIPSFKAINNGNSPVTATITATPVSNGGFAYIPNSNSKNVSVIDIASNTVVATIPVGSDPIGVSVSPDGKMVYIANQGSNEVSVISTSTNSVIKTLNTGAGSEPTGVVTSPDGSRVYVTDYDNNSLTVINTATNTIINTINIGTLPYGIAISPDGSKLYTANLEDNSISVINTATLKIESTLFPGLGPNDVCLSPDGNTLYVANYLSKSVAVINAVTNVKTAEINLGSAILTVALNPDGSELYVTNVDDNIITVINTATRAVITNIKVGKGPFGLSVTPDGRYLYVGNITGKNVFVINTFTLKVVKSVTVGNSPYAFGNFITGNICPTVSFDITISPYAAKDPTYTATPATGAITACQGTASASPNIQQFKVSGSNLTDDINTSAPSGFEVSLNPASGYASGVTIPQTGGIVNNTIVYVRSSISAPAGNISGNVLLSSSGATSRSVPVKGTVYDMPTVNQIPTQPYTRGAITTAINFTGSANEFIWTNDTPGIGLASSGTGNILPFTTLNAGDGPITATIIVTPVNTETGCSGTPVTFSIIVSNQELKPPNIIFKPLIPTPALDPNNNFAPNVTSDNHDSPFIFSSSDPSVATIIANTDIHVVGPGITYITVKQDGNASFLPGSAVQELIIQYNQSIIFPLLTGKTTCDADFAAGATSSNNTIPLIYDSSNKAVATVSADGIIHIIGIGTTNITISQPGNELYTKAESVTHMLAVTGVPAPVITVTPDFYGSCDGLPVTYTAVATNAGDNPIYQWKVNGNNAGANHSTQFTSSTLKTGDKITCTIITTNACGTVSVTSQPVSLSADPYTTPLVSITPSINGPVCQGTEITFTVTTGNVPEIVYQWEVNGYFAGTNSPVFTSSALNNGDVVTCVIASSGKCVLPGVSQPYTVLINPSPTVTFAGQNLQINQGSSVQLNPAISGDIISYTWTPSAGLSDAGIANPVASPFVTTNYHLQVTTATGCTAGADIKVNVNSLIINIPNTFTPNGDGVNDVWNIGSLIYEPECTVAVYNRYGNLIFQSKGYTKPWDGTYNGNILPMGTYYYIIDPKNGSKLLSGYVTIIR